jgi:peptide chain release factor subunit 1
MPQDIQTYLKDLSERYDTASRSTYLSLYLNKSSYTDTLTKRERICLSLLHDDERTNFIQTLTDVQSYLKKQPWSHIAVFASNKNHYLQGIILPVPVSDAVIVDSSPYIRPLAQLQDTWESFTLVVISSDYAKIDSITLGQVTDEKKLSIDLMNKHKKGGCSQARFQRLRKGAIHAFFIEVKEALEKIPEEQIILAGPGLAKQQFKAILPKHLQDIIVAMIDVDAHDEHKLLHESIQVILHQEEQKSIAAVHHLKQEILRDGLAVYGIDETLSAVQNGQVELLLIEKDYRAPGWICEHCQLVHTGQRTTCSNCGQPVSQADVLEEILEFAERTDAHIEFTASDELAPLGHVGGILRYR